MVHFCNQLLAKTSHEEKKFQKMDFFGNMPSPQNIPTNAQVKPHEDQLCLHCDAITLVLLSVDPFIEPEVYIH